MYGIRLSLKTLFLICLYFAICSTLYVSANLWLGTLVVLATIVWLVATTARAFQSSRLFFVWFFRVRLGMACVLARILR